MVGLAETQFDVKFRLLGVPVRIHPFFWVVSAVMGWQPNNLPLVLLWVLCVFVSILVHEYGHALMSKAFGCTPRSCCGEWAVFVTARESDITARAAGRGARRPWSGVCASVAWSCCWQRWCSGSRRSNTCRRLGRSSGLAHRSGDVSMKIATGPRDRSLPLRLHGHCLLDSWSSSISTGAC